MGIDADDDTLRRHLAAAEVPALLLTIAHLTGDRSLLREDMRAPGWLFAPQGGLTDSQQAEAREAAFDVLTRLRDGSLPPVGPPGVDDLRAITGWAMGTDTSDLLDLFGEEIAAPAADPKAPGWRLGDLRPGSDFTVAIIGAGFSGLLAAHRLAQAGVPFVVLEKNAGLGGTWFDNTYPGCRTDVASHLYNYSFAPRPDWADHFSSQAEVLDYLRTFADQQDLTRHIRFGTEVTALTWDDEQACWWLDVTGPDGERRIRHHAVISAVGQLSRPALPDIPGRDTFTGPAFHSARWDHSVAVEGRRVAVVGTGASAYQLIPEIAGVASEVVIFQRNPPWLRPTPHYHHPLPDSARWLFAHLPYYAQWYRFWLFAPGLRGILEGWIVDHDYPPTERAVSALNNQLRENLVRAMRAQLTDAPELADVVMPGYPVGAKRVLRDDGRWFATLKRDDVRLVTDPIEAITPAGLTAGGEHIDADIIVYATGFRASRFLEPMRVTGQGGVDLHETWNGVPQAYLGVTVPQFPNLFCLYGPNTNLVGQGGSIVYFSECGVRYVVDALRELHTGGHRALQVRKDVHERYNAWVDDGNRNRAWGFSAVGGWYNDGGRSATNWPFTAGEYWRRTRHIDPGDYEFL